MTSLAPSGLLFDVDWQPEATGVRSRELAATWSRLQMAVGGQYLTIVQDLDTDSVRHSISVPTYPLAEWIAFNWWRLLYETDKGSIDVEGDPHQMRHIGDGFAWPDVDVRAIGGATRLMWSADPESFSGRPVRYITSGEAIVSAQWLRRSFESLVEATLARLDEAGVHGTPLQKEWAALQALDEEEVSFCEACGRLGLDPFYEGADFVASIEVAFDGLDEANRDDLFDTVAPAALGPSVDWFRRAASEAESGTPPQQQGLDRWRQMGGRLVISTEADERPWLVGYRQARAVRSALGFDPSQALTLADLPVTSMTGARSPDTALQAVSVTRDGFAAVVLGWQHHGPRELFASARGVWALLFDSAPSTLITTAHTYRQGTSRAFAAELLAPAEGIRKLTGGRSFRAWSVADHFGVSEMVVTHQIENQLQIPPRETPVVG